MQHFIKLPIVIERTSLSRSTIYLKISKGTFPKQIKLGERAVGWLDSDVNTWIQEQISSSKNGDES